MAVFELFVFHRFSNFRNIGKTTFKSEINFQKTLLIRITPHIPTLYCRTLNKALINCFVCKLTANM